MADETITMRGHKEIIAAFQNSPRIVQDVGMFHMRIFGNWTAEEAVRHTLNAGAVDTNELIQGIHQTTKKVRRGVETIVKTSDKADEYNIFIEKGTKPHRPPVSALQGWADRHGIPVWAVVRKIEREGTEPRWIWRDTFEQVQKKCDSVTRDIGDDLERKI
jgi:hypothetical protein